MGNETKTGEVLLQKPVNEITVIIPAFNEEESVASTVEDVENHLSKLELDFEIIVVDDGSTDNTKKEALKAGARVLIHNKNMGYGNSIMDGISIASYPVIAILDADGTYPVSMLPKMIDEANRYDMVIGARVWDRKNTTLKASVFRKLLYFITLYLASERTLDINSGFRVFHTHDILDYRQLLCPTFSFTTTLTLLKLFTSKSIFFLPIKYGERMGTSKVAYFRDAFKTFAFVFMLANLFKIYRVSLAGILFIILINGFIALLRETFNLAGTTTFSLLFLVNAIYLFVMIAMGMIAQNQHFLFKLHGNKK